MNEDTMLKEILNALKLHGEQMNKKFAEMDAKFDKRFDDMDKRFDRLEKKVDGIRVDLTDTQEFTNFLLSRNAKHEEKIRNLTTPQNGFHTSCASPRLDRLIFYVLDRLMGRRQLTSKA